MKLCSDQMGKKKSVKLTIAASIILIFVGVLLAAYGYLSYYNDVCYCPAQIIGQPAVPCLCYSPFARFCIEIGVLLMISGIWWAVLGYHRRSPFVLKHSSRL